VRILKKLLLAAAILMLAVGAVALYLLRGGFREFEIKRYPAPPAAFTNWNDVLTHPRDITLTTLRTGVVHMDACLNLDPTSPRQADCDHAPRDLPVLVHFVHHPRFGNFLIDAGFDDSFTQSPPYGSYAAVMKLFNWSNGVTNRQEVGEDLRAQLARLNIRTKAVFFTHLHPDHTAGVQALAPDTEFVFGSAEASFLAKAAVANHFSGKSKFFGIDFPAAPTLPPLGHCVDLFGDGSFWAISAPGHTDDDIAFLINGPTPVLLTGDASHFAWAFQNGVAPRGWNSAGTAHGYTSLEQLRSFANAYPGVKLIFGHDTQAF
jgi:glyoxylase-like metal-dependent hydrolase (beta-lactamase superfamily II)